MDVLQLTYSSWQKEKFKFSIDFVRSDYFMTVYAIILPTKFICSKTDRQPCNNFKKNCFAECIKKAFFCCVKDKKIQKNIIPLKYNAQDKPTS